MEFNDEWHKRVDPEGFAKREAYLKNLKGKVWEKGLYIGTEAKLLAGNKFRKRVIK